MNGCIKIKRLKRKEKKKLGKNWYGIEYISTEEPFRCLRLGQQLAVPAPKRHSATIFPLILHENMAAGSHSYVQRSEVTNIFLNNHRKGHHFYFKKTKAVPKKKIIIN